ncbi:MAG: type II secretion system protein [Sedimentisphaerales bacterium]|nr:type II secretion system protein [Sedimentisphaerales bacterium]
MKTRRAFTLIELLVVISIIALLVSILMPALTRARQQAKAVMCLTYLKQWGTMYLMYGEDNKDSFPTGWNGGTMWMVDLLPYYEGSDDIRLCPSAIQFLHEVTNNEPGTFTAWGKYGNPGYYGGWTPIWGIEGQYGSYGVNGWCHNPLSIGVAGTYNTPAEASPLYWRKMNQNRGNEIPVMGGCMWDGTQPFESDQPPVFKGEQLEGSGMSTFCLDRHNGGPNMLFMDNTVRKVGLKELWSLRWHKQWVTQNKAWPDWMDVYPDP